MPNQKQRLAEWTQKQDLYTCCIQETHFRCKDIHRLKVRRWKKVLHANGNDKKVGVAIFISDKIDLKIKNVIRGREGLCAVIKESIHERI